LFAESNAERFVCIDCGTLAPVEDDSGEGCSTLLSLQHGWRIGRRVDESGAPRIEARCSSCVARHKRSAAQPPPVSGTHTTAERFVDFGRPRESVEETTHFRSSWLASSLRALRTRGYFDAYHRRLPSQFHGPVLETVAGAWLPIDVAVAHYAAIDSLGIAPSVMFDMGREVQDHAQAILAPLALRAAKDAGVTPWVVFGQARKLWERTWRGGGFAVDKLGPKDAELELAGWTVASSGYIRHAMRGVCDGMLGMFCQKVYVREVAAKCRKTSLVYRIAWA
jgi:hypothetical protein